MPYTYTLLYVRNISIKLGEKKTFLQDNLFQVCCLTIPDENISWVYLNTLTVIGLFLVTPGIPPLDCKLPKRRFHICLRFLLFPGA